MLEAQIPNEKWLAYNHVKGMAAEYQNQLYTLNFEQQKHALAIINQAVPLPKEFPQPSDNMFFPYSKLIIYRFNQPDLELIPISLDGHRLIFEVADWLPGGFFIEAGRGELDTLLSQTLKS